MIIDITEKKEAEKQEKEHSLRLKAIFNGTNDAITLTNDDGKYVQVNPAAARMLGYSMNELLNLSVFDIVDQTAYKDKGSTLWKKFHKNGDQSGIIRLKRKDKKIIFCVYNATANILPGVHLSILTDISEQKLAEDALKKSEEKYRQIVETAEEGIFMIDENGIITFTNKKFGEILQFSIEELIGSHLFNFMDDQWKVIAEKSIEEKTNAELDRFVYSASHELRSPLMSLLGLINHALPEEEDPDKLNRLNYMQSSVLRLDSFIRDIINYSKNSRLVVENEKINFKVLINESIKNFHYMPENKKIKTFIEISGESDFYSDKKRLVVLLNNLISNAIKYHNSEQKAPFIKISVRLNPMDAQLTISDNGIGISSDYVDKVFNMFYRATSEKSGSGLGFCIVKEILEKITGTIRFESEEGISI
ncbi:MAG: PAS domain-containing sensor histidine kinase [Bacteroidota bacterium]|nr:PAS domain-containing sensor histidine kinase [Bacteroidota bacterium]